MKKSFNFLKILFLIFAVFNLSGCFSSKEIEIKEPNITKRVATSEILNVEVLNIQKQSSTYIIQVKNILKNGDIEYISFKALDVGLAETGDSIKASIRNGIATNIEVTQKNEKNTISTLSKEDDSINIDHEIFINEKPNEELNSTTQEDINILEQNTSEEIIVFEEGEVDTRVIKEEIKKEEPKKSAKDRQSSDINPPSSTIIHL